MKVSFSWCKSFLQFRIDYIIILMFELEFSFVFILFHVPLNNDEDIRSKKFLESFEKNSFALSRNNLSSIKRPENNLPEDSGSLLCCKKRKVIKSCLGLCITKSGNARSEIVIGECDIYLNDIKNCLTNAKSNKFVKSIES